MIENNVQRKYRHRKIIFLLQIKLEIDVFS